MQFAFTEEQEQFRDIVARFCRDKSQTPVVRRLIESEHGFDPEVWKQMCQELGLVGLHIPEAKGGSGFSAIELGIVMEEFGRSLMPAPYFASAVLACTAVAEMSDVGERERLLGALMAGEKLGTLALDSQHGDPVTDIRLSRDGKLTGTLKAVLDGAAADLLLVIAGDAASATLNLVEPDTDGVTITRLRTMDGTRRLCTIEFSNAAATQLAQLNGEQIKRIYDTALVALASEMSGGAQVLLQSAIEYTKMRVQFGRSIGSFQAIKHRLADLHVDVELAKVAAWQAAASLAAGEDVSTNASLAKFMAADTYVQSALECIQLHGGIGFTWENDTHLWYRRAKSSEVFLGTPAFHRERMLQEMNA